MKVKKICLLWPPQAVITESLFRHFSGLAEVASYLAHSSKVVKTHSIEVSIHDCAIVPHTALNMAQIAYGNDLIAIFINMNNIMDAINVAKFFKSVDKKKKILAYGEAVCCNSKYFAHQDFFDYVIDNGQFELGIEAALCDMMGMDLCQENRFVTQNEYRITNKIIKIKNDVYLQEDLWGVPDFSMIPLENYLNISNGEIHITACKGCPFGCEFCNEKYVSTQNLRYRDPNTIIKYLSESKKFGAKSVYLDASTFTYDRDWVEELCEGIIESELGVLPWKTCTRLDHLDDELIELMGRANCRRISIGVESINISIQKRNNKVIEIEKLKKFADVCIKNNILPRALLIIGLKGQNKNEIIEAQNILTKLKIDVRFRVLQDFAFMLNDTNVDERNFRKLDRWLVQSPINDMDINELRFFEYPPKKNNQNYT